MSTVVLGRRTSLAALLAVLGMLVAAPAYGSWPMARYDAKRQGTATGLSDSASPVAFWRSYLGGAIGAGQFLTTDVNGDGVPDAVLASSGQIVAKGTDDQVFWKTDLVASKASRAWAISTVTGMPTSWVTRMTTSLSWPRRPGPSSGSNRTGRWVPSGACGSAT